jgi:hypothetical protein
MAKEGEPKEAADPAEESLKEQFLEHVIFQELEKLDKKYGKMENNIKARFLTMLIIECFITTIRKKYRDNLDKILKP